MSNRNPYAFDPVTMSLKTSGPGTRFNRGIGWKVKRCVSMTRCGESLVGGSTGSVDMTELDDMQQEEKMGRSSKIVSAGPQLLMCMDDVFICKLRFE